MSDVEVIELSEEENEATLRKIAVVGDWVEGVFSVEYFLTLLPEASARGYTHWATQSDKTGEIWKNRVIFMKEPMKGYTLTTEVTQ